MIDLILYACLISAPDQCQHQHIPFDGHLFQCGLFAQADVAKWQAEHPKWRVAEYHCAEPRPGQDA